MSAIYKTILSGCLEFGSQRSYEQVLKLFQHRTENYYRNDILLKAEDIFQESSFTLTVPRFIKECPEKSWKNTLNLLGHVAEYAVAGDLRAWVISEGSLVEQRTIEPAGDKAATQAYLKGRKLVKEAGMEEEAITSLNRAIEKFERHAAAYERRGHINFKLRNFQDALYDFSKSIDINPTNPEPYWGRAVVKIKRNDMPGAIADLDLAIAKSIPHQPVYWSARRLKGECHLQLGEFQKSIFELRMVTKRPFTQEDPNFGWQKNAFFNFGRALFEIGEYKEAVLAFNRMFDFETQREEAPTKADHLLNRGLARQKAGESGYVTDFKAAAELGSVKAASLLEEMA